MSIKTATTENECFEWSTTTHGRTLTEGIAIDDSLGTVASNIPKDKNLEKRAPNSESFEMLKSEMFSFTSDENHNKSEKEKRSSPQYIKNIVPFCLAPILGDLENIKQAIINSNNVSVYLDDFTENIKTTTNLFIFDLSDKDEMLEINAYLAFVRGIFIYEVKKVDNVIIEDILNTVDKYSKELNVSLLKKSKTRLSRKGLIGAPSLKN